MHSAMGDSAEEPEVKALSLCCPPGAVQELRGLPLSLVPQGIVLLRSICEALHRHRPHIGRHFA